ncbi:hypothetical protein MGU_04733 [Metarhizium guizhouense ARSEF 977]|uniref:Uncharacterized protein n=1 Tax=Metarhizium guizhouense (strain ARSEF 977) TaxID=1276136 RepID=A0A0B4GZT3_METGA|nr:hypothetical protein MGU_04733 [Metarhizium guizhouense ARSEF 977]
MDFLKQAVNSAQGAGGNSNKDNNNQQQQQQGGDNQQNQGGNSSNNNNQNQQGGDQQQDYGDKAFDFVAKKAGLNLSREQEEKITDGARQAYEKYSGKSVDSKYSN